MIQARHRLSNRDTIKKLVETAPAITSRSFVVKYLSLQKGHSQFAVLVGVALAPKAVDRNSLRRRIREAVKKNDSLLRSPHLVVIIARRGILGRKFPELVSELHTLLQRISSR